MTRLLFITDFLAGLGFGERVVIGAVFVLVVLYMFRARRVAGRSVSAMGTLWLVTIAISAAAAVAIFLGWIDPEPARAVGDLVSWGGAVTEWLWGPISDFLDGLLPW